MLSNKELAQKTDNQPSDYDTLEKTEQTALLTWINDNFTIPTRLNKKCRYTSYGLKHFFERSPDGFYVTNGQFKGAMIKAGFEPLAEDLNELNWRFRAQYNAQNPGG